MAGRKDIVGKALKVAADYFAPNTDEYAANLSKFYGSTDPALRKRFYTGTSKDKDFTAFQESRHGTWLTDSPEDASSYALSNDSMGYRPGPGWTYEKTNQASRVIPAYAKIENPYRGEKPDWVMKQDNYKKAQSDWFDQLRSQGYDAWVPDSSNGSLAVVLKNQGTNVKSAIGNQGTFDTTKKHMGKSEGGRTGYGPGGVIDDIVKMAGKIVSGADEPAKTGMVRGTFPGSKMPSVDALSRNVDKFVYHSGTAKDIPEMKYGVSPQIGPWVREVLEGSSDDDAIDEIMENAVPVSWWSKEPSWAVVKVARELGKPIDQVTPEDLASYGHVALIPKKDPEAESLYWVGEEGLNMGPYSDVEDITGRKVKAYDADLYSGNYGPEGVERNEYITTKTVEPYLHLTGNELVDFLRKTGQYKKAFGGRAGYGGGGVSTDNNSVSGALNVARKFHGVR